jgi:hypothetical protein
MTTNSSAEELMDPDEIEIIISKAEYGKTTIKPRRCRLSRHCLSATILAIISVSLLIGATLYLLIGNIPTFAGMQVQLDQSGEAQGLDITAQSLPLSIRLNLIVTGTLDSQSYISYIVNSLTVKVSEPLLIDIEICNNGDARRSISFPQMSATISHLSEPRKPTA